MITRFEALTLNFFSAILGERQNRYSTIPRVFFRVNPHALHQRRRAFQQFTKDAAAAALVSEVPSIPAVSGRYKVYLYFLFLYSLECFSFSTPPPSPPPPTFARANQFSFSRTPEIMFGKSNKFIAFFLPPSLPPSSFSLSSIITFCNFSALFSIDLFSFFFFLFFLEPGGLESVDWRCTLQVIFVNRGVGWFDEFRGTTDPMEV